MVFSTSNVPMKRRLFQGLVAFMGASRPLMPCTHTHTHTHTYTRTRTHTHTHTHTPPCALQFWATVALMLLSFSHLSGAVGHSRDPPLLLFRGRGTEKDVSVCVCVCEGGLETDCSSKSSLALPQRVTENSPFTADTTGRQTMIFNLMMNSCVLERIMSHHIISNNRFFLTAYCADYVIDGTGCNIFRQHLPLHSSLMWLASPFC